MDSKQTKITSDFILKSLDFLKQNIFFES